LISRRLRLLDISLPEPVKLKCSQQAAANSDERATSPSNHDQTQLNSNKVAYFTDSNLDKIGNLLESYFYVLNSNSVSEKPRFKPTAATQYFHLNIPIESIKLISFFFKLCVSSTSPTLPLVTYFRKMSTQDMFDLTVAGDLAAFSSKRVHCSTDHVPVQV
jgi:hypothetical protein